MMSQDDWKNLLAEFESGYLVIYSVLTIALIIIIAQVLRMASCRKKKTRRFLLIYGCALVKYMLEVVYLTCDVIYDLDDDISNILYLILEIPFHVTMLFFFLFEVTKTKDELLFQKKAPIYLRLRVLYFLLLLLILGRYVPGFIWFAGGAAEVADFYAIDYAIGFFTGMYLLYFTLVIQIVDMKKELEPRKFQNNQMYYIVFASYLLLLIFICMLDHLISFLLIHNKDETPMKDIMLYCIIVIADLLPFVAMRFALDTFKKHKPHITSCY